jgi:hypothetical protein
MAGREVRPQSVFPVQSSPNHLKLPAVLQTSFNTRHPDNTPPRITLALRAKLQ